MKTGKQGIEVLKHFEGLHDGDKVAPGLQPQMDQPVIGIWTVGWGHAIIDPRNKKFLKGEKDRARAYELYPNLSIKEANELLAVDLKVAENIVNVNTKIFLSQNEFDALVCHTYNTGGSKRLFDLVNSYSTIDSIYKWFRTKYVTSLGKKLSGLVRRRWCEADLFRFGVVDFHLDDFR